MSSPVPAQPDMITLGDIIHAVWQRKWLCISIVLAFFLVGLAVSVKKTPKYTFSQTLVNASVPPGYWNNDPRAMRVGPELASYLKKHNDKVMQRNHDALDVKIEGNNPGVSPVTLKTEAPESRLNEVRSRLDDALKTLDHYQQPWLAAAHQSLIKGVDLDEQAISSLQRSQRDLARSTKLVVTHSMPSPDAILSATRSSGPSAPPHETSTVTESLERIANAEDAQLMLASANLEQQMLSVKQQLVEDQAQLSLIQPAHFIGDMQRSQDPVGMSSKLLLLMFTVLGMVVAVFVSLLLAFSTSRSSESTNES